MGSRSSNGDPQLSNFDNETFAWNRSSIAPRPTACRISIGDELLGRGSLFSGIFQPFQKADPWIFRDRIPSQPLFGRIESENERCFSGDPLDPLNRYEPIMGRENFVISRLLWKYSHLKLSS